jgi:putative Holliday junction resolvase
VALDNDASAIIVGQSLDLDGKTSLAGRRAARLAAAVRTQVDIPVVLWDESYSTQEAQRVGVELNLPRRKRSGHMDEIAATVILQTYLDSHPLDPSSS